MKQCVICNIPTPENYFQTTVIRYNTIYTDVCSDCYKNRSVTSIIKYSINNHRVAKEKDMIFNIEGHKTIVKKTIKIDESCEKKIIKKRIPNTEIDKYKKNLDDFEILISGDNEKYDSFVNTIKENLENRLLECFYCKKLQSVDNFKSFNIHCELCDEELKTKRLNRFLTNIDRYIPLY